MTLVDIFWSFISWEMLVCVIAWIASWLCLAKFLENDTALAAADLFKFATLNAIFVLLLMKL